MTIEQPGPHRAVGQQMRPFQRRRLTDGEVVLGRDVFGDEIDWRQVRIAQGPPLFFTAMVPLGRTIWFGRWRASWDFSHAPMLTQSWFVHELAHVWQSARGIVLAYAKLSALTRKAYAIAYDPERPFAGYNIEAQAEVARLLFLARSGEETALSRDALEGLWARRHGA